MTGTGEHEGDLQVMTKKIAAADPEMTFDPHAGPPADLETIFDQLVREKPNL